MQHRDVFPLRDSSDQQVRETNRPDLVLPGGCCGGGKAVAMISPVLPGGKPCGIKAAGSHIPRLDVMIT
jgi:hypothetical protein